MTTFLLATRNPGKIEELRALFVKLPIDLIGLDEAGIHVEINETGATFAENSRLKAARYARLSGLHSIADDSGLEVEALGGKPGVFSARYAGAETGYDVKIPALLSEMLSAESTNRNARFLSNIAIADPSGVVIHDATGICSGKIAFEPRGSNGFGYDPVFIPDGYDKTFGELDDQVKQTMSHRARATLKIIRFLRDFA